MIQRFAIFCLAFAGLCYPTSGWCQDVKADIQRTLEREYALTKTTSNKTDIVTPGAVLVLQKDKLVMAPLNALPCSNTWKDGRFTQNTMCKAGAALTKFSLRHNSGAPQTRTFVSGEKFWVTSILVADAGVTMEFYSDAINDVRFRASLMIPFNGQLPSPDDALRAVREVVTVVPQEASAPTPPPAPAPLADIPPPPPPPDAPPAGPPTVAVGQTREQVEAILGAPLRKAVIGGKIIYSYQDMKIIFLNGRVKDIQ
jgi:hypothetical protein